MLIVYLFNFRDLFSSRNFVTSFSDTVVPVQLGPQAVQHNIDYRLEEEKDARIDSEMGQEIEAILNKDQLKKKYD